jgi:hypothetical protein
MECGRQAALFSLRNQREIETKLAGRDISIGRTCQLDPDVAGHLRVGGVGAENSRKKILDSSLSHDYYQTKSK